MFLFCADDYFKSNVYQLKKIILNASSNCCNFQLISEVFCWIKAIFTILAFLDMTERLHFHFHALEKEMATHSSVLAWRIPGMEEPGGLPSLGSHRVRHNWSNLAAAAAAVWFLQWKTLKRTFKEELPIFSAIDLWCDQLMTCLSASSVETAVPSGFA